MSHDRLRPIHPGDPGRCRAAADVLLERQDQEGQWSREHDDAHTEDEWRCLIDAYLARDDFRRAMVQVAAVAIAAIEAHDRGHS